MSLTLNSAEIERLSRAIQLLTSPLTFPSADEWRLAVNREIKPLLGADTAGFLLPVADGLALFSEEHDPAELARYPDFPPPPLIDGTCLWEHMVKQGVVTLSTSYGANYPLYLNSEYYQEYAGANGAHDTLASAVSLGGVDARGMASLHFWHARPDGPQFGARERSILQLLHPALRAGAEAYTLWGRERLAVVELLEDMGQAAMICDSAVRILHQTASLERVLGEDPEGAVLRSEMLAVASMAMRRKGTDLSRTIRASCAAPFIRVRTSYAVYQISTTVYGSPATDPQGLILVALERCTPLPRSNDLLKKEFGLTPAEIRVARLIGEGHSNADIAQQLFISPHTARRHTERIMVKLKARSRAEVGPKLL